MFASTDLAARIERTEGRLIEDGATAAMRRHPESRGFVTPIAGGVAGAAGSDVAVVTTQPGSKSQENVQRQGFHLLYTRAVLVREA